MRKHPSRQVVASSRKVAFAAALAACSLASSVQAEQAIKTLKSPNEMQRVPALRSIGLRVANRDNSASANSSTVSSNAVTVSVSGSNANSPANSVSTANYVTDSSSTAAPKPLTLAPLPLPTSRTSDSSANNSSTLTLPAITLSPPSLIPTPNNASSASESPAATNSAKAIKITINSENANGDTSLDTGSSPGTTSGSRKPELIKPKGMKIENAFKIEAVEPSDQPAKVTFRAEASSDEASSSPTVVDLAKSLTPNNAISTASEVITPSSVSIHGSAISIVEQPNLPFDNARKGAKASLVEAVEPPAVANPVTVNPVLTLPPASSLSETPVPSVQQRPVLTPLPKPNRTIDGPAIVSAVAPISTSEPVPAPNVATSPTALPTGTSQENTAISAPLFPALPAALPAAIPQAEPSTSVVNSNAGTGIPVAVAAVRAVETAPVVSAKPLQTAGNIEVECNSVRAIDVHGKIKAVVVHDEKVCQAIYGENGVSLVGKQPGVTLIEVHEASAIGGPTLFQVQVTSVSQRATSVAKDLDQVKRALAAAHPNASLTLKSLADGSVEVKGKVDSEQSARSLLEMTRKLLLVPIVDKVVVR